MEDYVSYPPIIPKVLNTSPEGPNGRLKVDVGQTGFFEGREFRTFYEFSLAEGASRVFRIEAPVDVILWDLSLTLTRGSVRLETVMGGTQGGTFGQSLPVFGRNMMAGRPVPHYTPQMVATTGGTHSGGVILDVLLAQTAAQGNQTAATVGQRQGDERGVAAGIYYLRLTNSGSSEASGIITATWEERPGA